MISIMPINRQAYIQYSKRVSGVNANQRPIPKVNKVNKIQPILTGAYLYNEEKQIVHFKQDKGRIIDTAG